MLGMVAAPKSLSLAAALLCVTAIGVSVGGGSAIAVTAEQVVPSPSARAGDGPSPGVRLSANPSISAHGRHVAFDTTAALVPRDTNGARDVYLRDRYTGTLQRISVSSTGRQGAGNSVAPALSGNGRYVAFTSRGRLAAGDTNRHADVYVRDRVARTTELVSVGTRGRRADGSSYDAQLSADGRFVVFTSDASNLVPGDTNALRDVFVRDRSTAVTRRVSVTSRDRQRGWYAGSPAISAGGRYVAFTWDDNYRLHLMVRDRAAGTTRQVARDADQAAVSARGRLVAFTRPISVGVGWDPAGEATGTPYDVFVRDRASGTTRPVSVSDTGRRGDSGSFEPATSARARIIAFTSIAANLVDRDTNNRADVFVRNRATGRTVRVSVSSQGSQGDGASLQGAVSADGRHVAFTSHASDLVARDPNGHASDIFVRDLRTQRTQRISGRGELTPAHLDPAALRRGPDPRIPYLVRDVIRDGGLRVAAPTWGWHDALWRTSEGYLVRDRRGQLTRLVTVSPTGRSRVLTGARGFLPTAVSPNGRLAAWAEDVDREGLRQVVKVADLRTGTVLARQRFRVADVVAVNRGWVLVSQRVRSARTFWWNYRKDAVSPVYDQAASGVDLRHDRIVFDLRTDGDFCNRVALLSEPSRTLWRSCRIYPHAWSPDGTRALATATYFDAAGTYFWATIDGTTGTRLGRVTGRLDWDAAWEDDEHFLTLAQSDQGKAAIVRCTVGGRCERASRLWDVPLPEVSVYYAPPPVVLSGG